MTGRSKVITPWIIDDRKINIAVVGCGRIAKNHIEAIKQHSHDLQLTAVCDSNIEVLKKITLNDGVEGYDNLTQLLNGIPVDVVVLCTPSGLHSAQTIEVAQAGHHIITEKPMATRWEDGLKMVKACEDAHVRLFVVKQNRRNATLQLLTQAIEIG